MTVEKAAVGRARRGGEERDRTGGDQVERGGRREERRGGEDGLSSSSCEHGRGSHALQVTVYRIYRDETKRLYRNAQK